MALATSVNTSLLGLCSGPWEERVPCRETGRGIKTLTKASLWSSHFHPHFLVPAFAWYQLCLLPRMPFCQVQSRNMIWLQRFLPLPSHSPLALDLGSNYYGLSIGLIQHVFFLLAGRSHLWPSSPRSRTTPPPTSPSWSSSFEDWESGGKWPGYLMTLRR